MMIAQVFLKEGDFVPQHSHHNEQLTYIISGALHFHLGEKGEHELVVRAGEVLVIPSNLPHSALASEDTLDVDVFSPPRERLVEQDGRLPAQGDLIVAVAIMLREIGGQKEYCASRRFLFDAPRAGRGIRVCTDCHRRRFPRHLYVRSGLYRDPLSLPASRVSRLWGSLRKSEETASLT